MSQANLGLIDGAPIFIHAMPSSQSAPLGFTLWPQRQAEELRDDIAQTVNYSAVWEETKNSCVIVLSKLIETPSV